MLLAVLRSRLSRIRRHSVDSCEDSVIVRASMRVLGVFVVNVSAKHSR